MAEIRVRAPDVRAAVDLCDTLDAPGFVAEYVGDDGIHVLIRNVGGRRSVGDILSRIQAWLTARRIEAVSLWLDGREYRMESREEDR